MGINELIGIVSAAYPDSMVAAQYWDFIRERPRRNAKAGDTLALFLANEIAETFDSDLSDEEQLNTAMDAIARAVRELDAVSGALAGEIAKRSKARKTEANRLSNPNDKREDNANEV